MDIFWRFLYLGCTSFGGPAAHIGYFRQSFVVKQKWLLDHEFSQLVALCQFLPGPASSQLGFAIGYARANLGGAILAFIAFTAPSIILLILFAKSLALIPQDIEYMLVYGLKLAAVVIVADAVWGMWRNLCVGLQRKTIAILSAGIILMLPYLSVHLAVLLAAAVAGALVINHNNVEQQSIRFNVSKRAAGFCLSLFFTLLALSVVLVLQSSPNQDADLAALFAGFYQSGALVFGGGHVVLPLLQDVTVANHWLDESSFLAGYGASQSVPGPLFSFAAYLGFSVDSQGFPLLNAGVATFAIFLPGFLLLMGVLPFWQKLQAYSIIKNAIAGVNAGVVGLLGAAFVNPVFTSAITHTNDIFFVVVLFALFKWRSFSPLLVVLAGIIYAVATVLIDLRV